MERDGVADKCDFALSDVLNWKTDRKFDITIAIGFWDYIQDPPERLRLIRNLTNEDIPLGLAALLDLAHAGPQSAPPVHSRLPGLFFPQAEGFRDAGERRL